MPVYNEKATVMEAIGALLEVDLPVESRELVVVDDGSSDGTSRIIANGEWGEVVRVVTHPVNRGKGAAIRTGLECVRGRYAGVVDADLELDAIDLQQVCELLVTEGPDAVFGVRQFPRATARNIRYWLGNRGVTHIANLLYRCRMSDIMTAYKVMSTELFRSLPLNENGFGVEPEITAWLLRMGATIREVPVAYEPRARKAGKKITMLDGFRVVSTLVRCRLSPMPRGASQPAATPVG